jgi:hypothetical protein
MLEKRQLLQQMLLEKLAIYMQKTETRPLSLILYKDQMFECNFELLQKKKINSGRHSYR